MRLALIGSVALIIGAPVHAFAHQGRGAQQQSDTFSWSSPALKGALVRVRNIRGDVSVEASSGTEVEVKALKVWRRGNPAAARIDARRVGDDIIVCVLFGAAQSCDSPVTSADSRAVGDVAIDIAIKLPSGMRIATNTINGDVSVTSDSRTVAAESVNGNVVVRSVQGSIVAMTVNGSVTAYLVEPVHAALDLQASGRLRSEFPIQITHAMRLGRIQGLIGGGGRKIELRALRGDISLRRAGPG